MLTEFSVSWWTIPLSKLNECFTIKKTLCLTNWCTLLYVLMYIHVKGILDLYYICSIFLYRQSLKRGWDIEMLGYRLSASKALGKWGMIVWQTNGGAYTHLTHSHTSEATHALSHRLSHTRTHTHTHSLTHTNTSLSKNKLSVDK